jgi:hypothetical protein
VSVLAFTPRRTLGRRAGHYRVAAVAPMVRVGLARVTLAAGVSLLTGEPGWGLLVAGILVAAWPKQATR